jgi:hypothetical protein
MLSQPRPSDIVKNVATLTRHRVVFADVFVEKRAHDFLQVRAFRVLTELVVDPLDHFVITLLLPYPVTAHDDEVAVTV